MKHTNFLNSLLLFAAATMFTACSGGHNPDLVQNTPSSKQTVISGTIFEELNDNSFSSGILVGSEALLDPKSASHFQFQVDLSTGGSIALSAFGDKILAGTPGAPQLKNAIVLNFVRPNDSGAITVQVSASGTTDNWSEFFKSIDASKPFEIGVDIHNDEAGEAHILIWKFENGNEQLLLDSAIDVAGSPGKGFGKHWGFTIQQAKLLSARLSSPRYQH